MKRLSTRLCAVLLAVLCAFTAQLHAKVIHLLPKPQQVTLSNGTPFALQRAVKVVDPTTCAYLTRFLTEEAGCTIDPSAAASINVTIGEVPGAYDFELDGFPNEAYSLEITENAVNIVAVTPTGVIRAAQTLSQLAQGYEGTPALEALTMKDWPAFKLRGFMHDVGRSFVSVEQLKKQIDALAHFKVNVFHWHFTENQAWRLQIKAYPQLTSDASMTRFPGKFYTQEECKEVQDYAWERGMVIIPEVDMPGHSAAFTRAMGHDMQTDAGVAELKVIIKEVCELFDKATYIHIGGDEVTITYPNFLETMIAEVKSYGKKAAVWNPISGVNVSGLDADMTQMWSSSGTKITGKANIDCRYNYTNHFDVFADLVGIYKSNIYYQEQGTADVPGFLSCPWNDRKTESEVDIFRQNNIYANTIASTERAWIGGGKQYIEAGGTTLPNSGEEFDEFADWERRFLFHKATTLADEAYLIPYVKQTNVRWKITDGFPNSGDVNATFAPETEGLKDSYTYNGSTYGTGIATGAGIYLSHVWPTVIPTYFGKNASKNQTAYAWTYVYSPVAQTAGALIEFQNYGRSERDNAPDQGKWDRKGSRIWLNDTEILPPTWGNSGVNVGSDWEILLKNENFTAREPMQLQLNAGWNKVFLKLPYIDASNVRLDKWMFTFVLTDTEGNNALENLIYSPYQCRDENAEQVSVKISEVRRSVSEQVGDKVGYYPTSLAETLLAKLTEIEGTLTNEMSAEERTAQIATINSAKSTFEASLSSATPNLPTPSTDGDIHYYSLKDKRGNKYVTSNGVANGVTGLTATTGAYLWKFVERTTTTFDIINTSDNSYLNPASAANNAQLKTSATRPDAAWTINRVSDGYVTITSGSVQLHQATGPNVLNWGSGSNTTDGGCLFLIEEVVFEEPEVGSLPFEPTTIVDGAFAEGTKWYTMQIGNNQYYITDNGSANKITLTGHTTTTHAASDLWCFVGNNVDGYQIYNKQAGAAKVLASSTSMTAMSGYGGTGGSTYPTLQPVSALPDGYVGRWDFAASDKIATIENGQFIILHGTSYAMNDFANLGSLAFWAEGKGAGSTFAIKHVEIVETGDDLTTEISLANGNFTASNNDGSWHSAWSSTKVEGLTFTISANNMVADNASPNYLSVYSGQSGSCTCTLSAPQGYVVTGYRFDYKLSGSTTSDIKITANGNQHACSTSLQHIEVSGLDAASVSFTQSGANQGVTYSNFFVTLRKSDELTFNVFPTTGQPIPYRIPAIAQANNGDIIAVADYRYSKQDIGMATNGKLDLHFRISSDNGETWGDIQTLVAGQGEAAVTPEDPNNMWVAFGDPCIVVDRESGEVLTMSCAGNVSYPNATYDKHQYIVTMRSTDNGQTWSTPVDVADHIYPQFVNSTSGSPRSMFVGSGKISQSKYIKAGTHYRIYCAVLYKDVNNVEKNFVLYSDDFGKQWKVLGGVHVSPIPSGANEPKADELPDGSVVVSSRISGGRKYNIFRYTDPEKAEGSWGTVATSSSSNNGVIAQDNATNGEILTVPVKRKSDDKKMYLFLQSVPFGPSRANVGIYYKELASLADFSTPADLAANWDGNYQVSYTTSAYSTMVWLKNNTLAFLYEENSSSTTNGYDIIYKNYTIEKLTNDAYEYCADVNENDFLKESMDARMTEIEGYRGTRVGNLTSAGYESISAAYDVFMENPSRANYLAFNKAVETAQCRTIEAGREYRVRNKRYDAYLTIVSGSVKTQALDESNAAQKITFSPGSEEGTWRIKGNNAYLGNPGGDEAASIATQATETSASNYNIVSSIQGVTYFSCLTPVKPEWPALHAKGTNNNVVRWNTTAEASQWYIEPVSPSAAELIETIITDCRNELALAGKVGYPATDNTATVAFQTAYNNAVNAITENNATEDIYNALVSARATYKSVTVVGIPENGKVYTITAVNASGDKAYIYYKNETVGYCLGKESVIPESAYFVCRTFDDNGVTKHAFVNTSGKFFVWKGKSGHNSNKGYNNSYDATYCPVWFKNQPELFGALFMVGKRSTGTATLVLNNALGEDDFNANSGENGKVLSSSYTSALMIEEVAYANKPELRGALGINGVTGIATFSAPFATVIPEGVTAHYGALTDDNEHLVLTAVEAGKAIPANQGVILTGATGIAIMAPATTETSANLSANILSHSAGAAKSIAEGTLILTNKRPVGEDNLVTAFYATNGGASVIAMNKAYLVLPSGNAVKLVFGGTATGIDTIENGQTTMDDAPVFDLSGRVVTSPVKGNIYVKNGKKFIAR